jgi:hypothetical protein
MRNLNISIILLLYFSNAFSESWSTTNNSMSIGKIIINGQEVNKSNFSIKGSGTKETVSHKVGDFSSINSRGSFDINYRQGKPALSITGDSNIIHEVVVLVKGGTLQLSMKKSYSSKLPLVINISSPDINKITINGTSNVMLKDINTAYLTLKVIGAVDLNANGKASNLDLSVDGAGDINIKSLIAEKVAVDLQGSGDIQLTATQQLNANLSGVGDIIFFGNPPVINKKISGAGDIESGS